MSFRKSLCIIVLVLSNLAMLCSCSPIKKEKISSNSFVLNTVATITIYGSTDDENLLDENLLNECFDICRRYESVFSRTDENSDIYKLNNRQISLVSDDTEELISRGLYFSELSNGGFDITIEPLSSLWDFTSDTPTVPSKEKIDKALENISYKNIKITNNNITFSKENTRIDLGGIAKGYIADKVKDYLVSQGVEKAIINLGGNVLCVGGKTDKNGFQVGIQRPFSNDSIASVEINDQAVVTSGTYERYFTENGKKYHHILNPKTGYPFENGLLSVTIIGENSCDCDALSTTCFALGLEEGINLINSIDDTYAIFITDDYKLHFSDNAVNALNIKY